MKPTPKSKLLLNANTISRSAAACLMATLLFGCQDGPDGSLPGSQSRDAQQTPPEGSTSFVSADGRNGEQTQDDGRENDSNNASAPGFENDGGAGEPRQVEEGDIYQVIEGSDLVLNLNSYRGLQIIDFSDVTQPKIIGRAQVSGYPVEMYQVDNRVYILLNSWRSYWRSAHDSDATADTFEGGGVIAVDISDKANPQITAEARVPGWIQTSRLTRGGGKEALYVVASEYNGGGQTNVKSFSVSNQGKLEEKSTLSLGGWVQAIQATGERLMVARYDYNAQQNRGSKVSVVDISSPEGVMVEGAQVQVDGLVQNKHNMNIVGDVMRVVSGNSWAGNTNTNHVETFNISDIHNPVALDHDTFGAGQQLFGTLFMEDRAFFVTYLRQDPFHAFSITADGQMKEESEFIVSGWNDYFRPVSANQRLIGIGKNDENSRNTMAVSLYDITNLKNPNPLITRAEIALDQSWSEAQWDDRAFSILEKGTNVLAADGVTREHGLILLPFSGWDNSAQVYKSGVQIFTFSNNTITRRGTMDHGTPVRRSFQADAAAKIAGNLSETELSLFDTNNPDNPVEKGRVELAPYYADFKIFGAYGVRHHDRSNYWGWWGNQAGQREDSLQIVPLIGDVDGASALAEIPVPAGAKTYKVGDRLVVTSMQYVQPANGQSQGSYKTDVAVWDLTNPLNPQPEGALTTTALEPSYNYYYGGGWGAELDDCFDCRGGYYGRQAEAKVVGDALLFPRHIQEQELEGTAHIRNIQPTSSYYGQQCYSYDADGNYQPQACTYHSGYRSCTQLTRVDGTQEPEVCHGAFYVCTQDAQGGSDCQEAAEGSIPTRESTYSYERYRYWTHYELSVLDLSDPDQPVLRPKLTMPADEEAVALVEDGSGVWVNYKQPTRLPGDARPYVRYFVKRLELSNPAAPSLGAAVNVPGELLAAQGDTLLTRDFLWGQTIVETSINKLKLHGGLAYLQATQRFVDQVVSQVAIDGAQRALVSHSTAWLAQRNNAQQEQHKLSILNLAGTTMTLSATAEVDYWASLQAAKNGRALFQVPGGLLVFNVSNPQSPFAQAYFPTRGWPTDLTLHNSDIYFSAGPYGLYKFDITTDNLSLP